ncbi:MULTISPECIES: protein kinase domain-containing protein [Nitrincola]|uniref:Serine/threonine-protein kinase D n=1 Tax=Nitrincola nitratireducens TaxID=1229521 RepID=W9UWL6_9GAMM|nr:MULTISPECIES: protein kinase [Nitrincola]EXJ09121.1 Serine/threonine-protein kinase D [Nitrincola nitratireducens]
MSKPTFNHRTLPQGYQLGDYVIQDLLGQGGFGIAYLAQDSQLQNLVVIKEYFPNELASRDGQTVSALGTNGQIDYEKGMARFLEEGRALARFNHPAVVRILKYFQQNNTAYLVMEFIDGEPLDSYLKRKHTLTPEVVEHLAKELLDGLAVVHQHGLIHRDIKPANIMLRPGGKPVLIDFGAAKEELAEKSHSVVVTPGYGALEQYSSKAKLAPATDLYAVGATLYKCLTAQTPEEATARVIDDTHIPVNQLPIAQQCPPGLVALIDQCMQLKEKERPQSAEQAKGLLSDVIVKDPLPLITTDTIEASDTTKRKSTKKASLLVSVLLGGVVMAFGGYFFIQSTSMSVPVEVSQPVDSKQTLAEEVVLIGGRYKDNKDGTVTDIETNLTWMRCSLGQTWTGSFCSGAPTYYNWRHALDDSKQTHFASKNDWRLPTVYELHAIVNCTSEQQKDLLIDESGYTAKLGDVFLDGGCEGEFNSPTIVIQAFPNTFTSSAWTSSETKGQLGFGSWGINFEDGGAEPFDRRYSHSVRLVRDEL